MTNSLANPQSNARWRASAPVALYLAIVIGFSVVSPVFLTPANLLNVLVQMSPIAVGAVGMTFVLLTAGIDLSMGAVMFLAGATGGVLIVSQDWPLVGALGAMLAVGLLTGCCNGWLVTRLGGSAFIVTLATMFVARGAGLWITRTRALNLPDEFRQLATERFVGVPAPVLILGAVIIVAHLTLTRTSFGRYLYAIGRDREAARRAGLPVASAQLAAYLVAGGCASIAGMMQVAQLAAVSPNLGQDSELEMIAAAVLGGTSLFGGRGTAGGAVLGAAFVQTVRNGLNLANADPFLYSVASGTVIFLAVLIDSAARKHAARAVRPVIRGAGRETVVSSASQRQGM